MREKELQIANEFGVTEKLQKLENEILAIDRVIGIDFDLTDFYNDIPYIIFLTKYDILGSLPVDSYWEARRKLKLDVMKVARDNGLTKTDDRVEDYGEHFYWVFQYDKSWTKGKDNE